VQTANAIAIDTFKNTPQLGRLTLRDEGKTIAIGKIIDITPNSSGYGKSVADALN
jgi:peptide chain release factor subunit 3